jgi:hypothetical protein
MVSYLRRLERVVMWEVDVQEEHTTLVRRPCMVHSTNNSSMQIRTSTPHAA